VPDVAVVVVGTAAAVVFPGCAVVAAGEEVGLAAGLLLPDPQAANNSPVIRTPTAKYARVFTAATLRPGTRPYKRLDTDEDSQ
jgi:hypothetical protein